MQALCLQTVRRHSEAMPQPAPLRSLCLRQQARRHCLLRSESLRCRKHLPRKTRAQQELLCGHVRQEHPDTASRRAKLHESSTAESWRQTKEKREEKSFIKDQICRSLTRGIRPGAAFRSVIAPCVLTSNDAVGSAKDFLRLLHGEGFFSSQQRLSWKKRLWEKGQDENSGSTKLDGDPFFCANPNAPDRT